MTTDSTGGRRLEYMVQLDALRGLAVICVVMSHHGPGALSGAFDLPDVGVRLFFVLSGFLITGILLNARSESRRMGLGQGHVLGAFYARRFLRIFPLYYTVLIACIAIGIPSAREYAPWHFTYMTNVLLAIRGDWLPALTHFWSLAVEEQFYLCWPAIVLFAPSRLLAPIFCAIILIGPASRLILGSLTGQYIPTILLTPSCLDSLGSGALLAFLRQRTDFPASRLHNLLLRMLGVGIGLYGLWFVLRYLQVGWTAKLVIRDLSYALMFSFVVGKAADGVPGALGRLLEWRPLVFTGTVSYGIYVYHDVLPLIDRMLPWPKGSAGLLGGEPSLRRFVAVLLACYIVAPISWFLMEKPLNELKSRFPYVKRRRERGDDAVLAVLGAQDG